MHVFVGSNNVLFNPIGNVTDGRGHYETTYQGFCNQLNLKDDWRERCPKKSMIDDQSRVEGLPLERETGRPESGSFSVLPRHDPDHNKFYSETTTNTHYKAPFPYTPAEEKPADFEDYSLAYKGISQFTDPGGHRRVGRNTWWDESGVYHNARHRSECPAYRISDPFAHLKEGGTAAPFYIRKAQKGVQEAERLLRQAEEATKATSTSKN